MRVVAIMATSDSTFHATRSSGGMQEKRALVNVPYWTLTLVFYMDIYDTRHTCYMPHATAAIDDVPEREMGNIRKSAQLNTNYIHAHSPPTHTPTVVMWRTVIKAPRAVATCLVPSHNISLMTDSLTSFPFALIRYRASTNLNE